MGKSSSKYHWLHKRPNSAKTIVERVKREAPGFMEHNDRFEEQGKRVQSGKKGTRSGILATTQGKLERSGDSKVAHQPGPLSCL